MSTRVIKIAYDKRDDKDTFRVISVKNSTEFLPGQIVSRSEVDRLCNTASWTVTLVPTAPTIVVEGDQL